MPRVSGLPPGFVPSVPPTPLPQDPQSQSTPRGTPINLYGPPPTGPLSVQRSSSSSSSVTSNYPKAMHSRSRSMGQPSVESFRSKTPIARPPSSLAGAPIYQVAPQSPGGYPVALAPGMNAPDSPRSTASRISGHSRSRSMFAGSTPAPPSRPLSTAPVLVPDPARSLRRPSSVTSDDSGVSGVSRSSRRSFTHYDPGTYNDPAFLASSEELPLSPNTHANTRANAARMSTPGPASRNSPALSYVSLKERTAY